MKIVQSCVKNDQKDLALEKLDNIEGEISTMIIGLLEQDRFGDVDQLITNFTETGIKGFFNFFQKKKRL